MHDDNGRRTATRIASERSTRGASIPISAAAATIKRRPFRRLLVALLAATALPLTVGAWVLTRPVAAGAEFGEGPDVEHNDVVIKTHRDVGQRMTDGQTTLQLYKGPVTLRSISFELEGDTVRQLGEPMVVELLPGARALMDTVDNYPLIADQLAERRLGEPRPVEGAVLTVRPGQEHTTYLILIGFEITTEGRTVKSQPDIEFTMEGSWRRHNLHLTMSRVFCSPKATFEAETCTFPDEAR
ncbi:hypothetical protein [Spirilliplanes yamanashiensis]|uniref:hypothetical protein n=1 Tax=Spirilliplanes yamanashiensis TaxID=42233 RepID=UPI00195036A1|nr:hypothetical protein [Spirilliplanes yamanashiensis]MDP9816439.1 hypothetical protein [Spirilliplanes yamanashiensis]